MKPTKPDGVETTWNVRPRNLVQISVYQRFDEPVRNLCYVGIADYADGKYVHRDGSSQGGFATFEEAEKVAMRLYEIEYEKEQKKR